jgi:cobaltochelatase CobN
VASSRGLSATDLAMQVVLPETDGRILTRAISFKGSAPNELGLEFAPTIHVPQLDRVAFVAELAAAWARLAHTPVGERRLAIVLSDYPARGGRAGYAVGLDCSGKRCRNSGRLGCGRLCSDRAGCGGVDAGVDRQSC